MNKEDIFLKYNTWQVERIIDIILHHYGRTKEKFTYLNVGCNNGVYNDSFSGYTINYEWDNIFIEPNPDSFIELKSLTESLKNKNILENVAISNEVKKDVFSYVPYSVIKEKELSEDLKTSGTLLNNNTESLNDEHLEIIEIETNTLDGILEKHNIDSIDFVSIGVEGYENKVFEKFDIEKYNPKLLKVNYDKLNDEQIDSIVDKLKNNYDFLNLENNKFIIVRKDILNLFKTNRRWGEVSKLGECDPSKGYKVDSNGNEVYSPEYIDNGDFFQDGIVDENPKQKITIEGVSKTTIVTGIWDLKREEMTSGFKRPFKHYLDKFEELLKTDCPMVIYIEKQYEDFVWERRDKNNTAVFIKEVSEFKTWFEFFDKVQEIRSNPEWYNKASWLSESTQAGLELYNPMVMSKMFMLNDASIANPFGTDYFLWVDGGITNTVHQGYFTHDKVINKIHHYLQKFLFVCFPYENYEIHGFDHDKLRMLCNVDKTTRVARAGVFGGHKDYISQVNALYYDYLKSTLMDNQMGTEESVFTILTYKHEDIVDRVMINDDGLFGTFFENLKNDTVDLITTRKMRPIDELKTYLYVITFNSPSQFLRLCENWSKVDKWFEKCEKVVLNNSTDRSTDEEYAAIFDLYNFKEYKKDNIGICGGRQWVAEHFDKTDGDYYLFLEDDMYIHDKDRGTCKSGFRTYVPELFNKSHKIMEKHGFDFLKFCYTEFFGDNNTQWAWYNVPQEVREQYWPDKKYLPANGLDPNAPRVKYNNIYTLDGLAYADGEIFYCNWPQLVSKEGNKKMFLTEKWAAPFEQTWMSYMYQCTSKKEMTPAILLATPCYHERFDFYSSKERREN